ncbi:alpha/beta hydrolase [bacterium]|nr:MAG: alpha/beta hydrolase [bacterium]
MKKVNKILLCASLIVFSVVVFSKASLEALEIVFDDYQYSFQLLRTMGYSCTGGADIAECLSTAYKIEESNNESWYKKWSETAERLEIAADKFLKEGHKESAMEAYFRSSNYYRTAGFFLIIDPEDSRIIETWRKSRECFQKGAAFSKYPIEFVQIPFEGTTLPGYLLLADNSQMKRPLLIIHSGFDGTAEELYFEIGALAVERGYSCLLFEGPGQGGVIREQKIPFRPNWETVVTPVVDFALEQPVVDPDRIGLIGISFGGYFAPRAAAFEHRLKVCVANGGIYDFYENMIGKFPPDTEEIVEDHDASLVFDKETIDIMKQDVGIEFFFANGMYTFGAKTPSELIRMLKPYSMREVAKMIQCTMLVVDSEGDQDLPGQAAELYKALECPKEFMLFTEQEGAEEHCQMGAVMISGERILNWLDDNLMEK